MNIISLFGIAGILASLYAIYVEKMANDYSHGPRIGKKKYVALCDIGEGMSCSRVLTSDYAKLTSFVFRLSKDHPLNLPNTYFGLMFYIAIVLYPMYPFTIIPYREWLLFGASLGSIAASCALAWILYFKLHDFCFVCATTYVINAGILWQAYGEVW